MSKRSSRHRQHYVGTMGQRSEMRYGRDAVSYAIERFSSLVIVLGSSQGGMIATALASSDERIAAVFAHNILDPQMADALRITRFPQWVRSWCRVMVGGMKLVSRWMPRLPIPMGFYLQEERIFRTDWAAEQYHSDPLSLTSYPLSFLVSLFSARMGFLRSDQIRCPVIVIAATGDPLFPFDVMKQLYQQIKAPLKELLVFDLKYHLLFNECLDAVLPRLVEALKHVVDKLAQVAETSEKA